MLSKILNLFAPSSVKIFKPRWKDGIIYLPCGNKIQATASLGTKDPLSIDRVLMVDGKYYGQRNVDGMWITDNYPIEFILPERKPR